MKRLAIALLFFASILIADCQTAVPQIDVSSPAIAQLLGTNTDLISLQAALGIVSSTSNSVSIASFDGSVLIVTNVLGQSYTFRVDTNQIASRAWVQANFSGGGGTNSTSIAPGFGIIVISNSLTSFTLTADTNAIATLGYAVFQSMLAAKNATNFLGSAAWASVAAFDSAGSAAAAQSAAQANFTNNAQSGNFVFNTGSATNSHLLKSISFALGGSATFTQNSDGSSNAVLTVTGGSTNLPSNVLTNQDTRPQIFNTTGNAATATSANVATTNSADSLPIPTTSAIAATAAAAVNASSVNAAVPGILTNNYANSAFLPNGNSSNAFYLSPRIDFSVPKIITMPGVPITQNQGIALDKRNYDVYMNQNNSIYKFNAAGSLIASNINMFPVFTNNAQWIMEDSDFINGQLVVPTMLYTAGPSQGNVISNLSFCVFDTNLNLIASYGQSNNMQSCSSLVDAPDLGILFALHEYDTTNLYEFSDVAPFTFIKKLAYGSPMKGNNDYVLQGIAYKFGNLYVQQNTGGSGTMWQVDPLTGTNSLLTSVNNSSLGVEEDEGLDWNGTNLFILVAGPPNYLSFSPPQAVQVNRFGKTKMNFSHSLNFQNDGIMSSQIGYPDPSADGLIADYPFSTIDQAGTIYDNSSFAKRMTGSLFTQPFTSTGVSGFGATFISGSQDMFVDQITSDYSGLTNLTISAWIMPSNGVGNMFIVSKYINTPNGEFFVDLTVNTLRFVTVNTNQNRVDITFTNAQVYDGKWHLITAIYNGSSTNSTANQFLYIDGGLVASGTNTFPLQANPISHFMIGAFGGGGFWEGNMDEIKLYNRMLTTNEILNAYNQFSPDKKFSSVTGKGTGLSALNFSGHFGVTNVPSGLANYFTTNTSNEQFVWYNQWYLTNGLGGGGATNVNFIDGQSTHWSTVGGSNRVDVVGDLTNNTTGNAATATSATSATYAPDSFVIASLDQLAKGTNAAKGYTDSHTNDPVADARLSGNVVTNNRPSVTFGQVNSKLVFQNADGTVVLQDNNDSFHLTWSDGSSTMTGDGDWVFNSVSGIGTMLTALDASELASGTVADARLSANVPLINGNQTFTGLNTFTNAKFSNPSSLPAVFGYGVDINGNITTNVATGGGSTPSGLVTNNAAANIVVTNAGVATTITSNSVTSGTFTGGGGGLTAIPASALTGSSTNTIPANIIVTNLVAGTFYTNLYGYTIQLQHVVAVPTVALVAGNVSMALEISGVSTNTVWSAPTAIGVGIAGAETNSISSFSVPTNGVFRFIDTSAGAGNSVALAPSSQIVQVGGTTIYAGTYNAASTNNLSPPYLAALGSAGNALISGNNYFSPPSTVPITFNEQSARTRCNFIGWVTNVMVDVNQLTAALGTGTNLFCYFYTNGVPCTSISGTILGNNAMNIEYFTNLTGSFYNSSYTNTWSFVASNTASSSSIAIRFSYSFRLLNYQ